MFHVVLKHTRATMSAVPCVTTCDFHPEHGAKRRAADGTTNPWQQLAASDTIITRSFIDRAERERNTTSVCVGCCCAK